MLGENIGEEKGKITGIRVLSTEGRGHKIEASFQATGTLLGIEGTNTGTYYSIMTPSGNLRGEGQGVYMSKDGQTAMWNAMGLGKLTGKGMAANYRGLLLWQTNSPKFDRLNNVAVVFEYETDENGNVHDKIWEWK